MGADGQRAQGGHVAVIGGIVAIMAAVAGSKDVDRPESIASFFQLRAQRLAEGAATGFGAVEMAVVRGAPAVVVDVVCWGL